MFHVGKSSVSTPQPIQVRVLRVRVSARNQGPTLSQKRVPCDAIVGSQNLTPSPRNNKKLAFQASASTPAHLELRFYRIPHITSPIILVLGHNPVFCDIHITAEARLRVPASRASQPTSQAALNHRRPYLSGGCAPRSSGSAPPHDPVPSFRHTRDSSSARSPAEQASRQSPYATSGAGEHLCKAQQAPAVHVGQDVRRQLRPPQLNMVSGFRVGLCRFPAGAGRIANVAQLTRMIMGRYKSMTRGWSAGRSRTTRTRGVCPHPPS